VLNFVQIHLGVANNFTYIKTVLFRDKYGEIKHNEWDEKQTT
jgi:hypothetical protein